MMAGTGVFDGQEISASYPAHPHRCVQIARSTRHIARRQDHGAVMRIVWNLPIVIKDLASIKLLQSLINIVQELNSQEEKVDAFSSTSEKQHWKRSNETLAHLFLNNDPRIADAHDSVESCLETLQNLGFDTANLNEGYGTALDFLMDGVINALASINKGIYSLLKR
jgi:hypothetical protein